MPLVQLSVVVAAYNAAATIEAQLTALVDQEWSQAWEVIVADNGSTDRTAAVVSSFAQAHPATLVRVIDASQQRGPAFARNAGAAEA